MKYHLLLSFFIISCLYSSVFSFYGNAQVVNQELAENPIPITTKYDSLLQYTLSDSDIVAANTEEIVDVLARIQGFQILDLASLGQYSSIGYRGVGKNNVIPVLNGIPLESESFGAWNWHDIPFYCIKTVQFAEELPRNNPNIFSSVNLETKSAAPSTPFTRVDYRIGDFDWSHVDITFARKLSSGLSFYGSGSTEHFADRFGDNRYRGSNVWFHLNHSLKGFDLSWQTLVSDRNVREISKIPAAPGRVLKNMPHSHNVKMFSLNLSPKNNYRAFNLKAYFWEIKDNAQGSLLYTDDFTNRDKKFGVILDGLALGEKSWQFFYHLDTYSTWIQSTFQNFHRRINAGKLSVSAVYSPESRLNFTVTPGIYLRSKAKDTPWFGKMYISYRPSDRLHFSASISKSGRFPAASEINVPAVNIFDNQNKSIDNILSYDLNIKYYFKNGLLQIFPFFLTIDKPYHLNYNTHLAVSNPDNPLRALRYSKISQISNGGIGLGLKMRLNDFTTANCQYVYQRGKKDRIFGAPHAVYAQLGIKNLEDKFTTMKVDTEITVSGYYWSARQGILNLPLYQVFSNTDVETQASALLKFRGSARVQTVTFFYEIDLLNKSGYQYVLGYPFKDRMVRVGLTWNFYN